MLSGHGSRSEIKIVLSTEHKRGRRFRLLDVRAGLRGVVFHCLCTEEVLSVWCPSPTQEYLRQPPARMPCLASRFQSQTPESEDPPRVQTGGVLCTADLCPQQSYLNHSPQRLEFDSADICTDFPTTKSSIRCRVYPVGQRSRPAVNTDSPTNSSAREPMRPCL